MLKNNTLPLCANREIIPRQITNTTNGVVLNHDQNYY